MLQHLIGEPLLQNPLSRNQEAHLEDYMSMTTNISEPKSVRGSILSNTPLSSNSFATHRNYLVHCTVRFRNDQFAPILRYGYLVQGNVTIKWVYYVKGLNHILFSIGQFCDAYLEVAFRKSSCHIHDLKGNDLLTGLEEHISIQSLFKKQLLLIQFS
ncbi:hypothetical protein Tco_0995441 [Tanacetum coccineum]